jgi:SEC-C motif
MLMALDRGTLSRIDRRVFAELDHRKRPQMVKVPLSDAAWSPWRRYCEAIGLSMGEAVAGLIVHELETVVGNEGDAIDVFAKQIARQAEERASRLDARERELDTRAGRLRNKEAHLAASEHRLRTQRMSGAPVRAVAKVGRNERCPCGSDFKYKHCHGRAGRRTWRRLFAGAAGLFDVLLSEHPGWVVRAERPRPGADDSSILKAGFEILIDATIKPTREDAHPSGRTDLVVDRFTRSTDLHDHDRPVGLVDEIDGSSAARCRKHA